MKLLSLGTLAALNTTRNRTLVSPGLSLYRAGETDTPYGPKESATVVARHIALRSVQLKADEVPDNLKTANVQVYRSAVPWGLDVRPKDFFANDAQTVRYDVVGIETELNDPTGTRYVILSRSV